MLVAGIAVAGALGAPARYALDQLIRAHVAARLPLGTLVINITGSLLLGVIVGLAMYHGFGSTPKTVLGTGFCGAYTTFSTFAYDTIHLAKKGAFPAALQNIVSSALLPALAAAAGLGLAAL